MKRKPTSYTLLIQTLRLEVKEINNLIWKTNKLPKNIKKEFSTPLEKKQLKGLKKKEFTF